MLTPTTFRRDGLSESDMSLQQAIDWAVSTCNRGDVGYSQAYRNQQTVNGITYYDCSSFINYALLAGGWETPSYAPNNNAFVTWNMGAELERLGFVVVTDYSTLRPGDIGVSNNATSQHTEMVYQVNPNNPSQAYWMGAHTDQVPLADQVSITYYYQGMWFDTLYRYTGDEPEPPEPPITKRTKMPITMYPMKHRRRVLIK